MNTEDSEFERIERETLRRAAFQRKVDDAMRIAFEAAWDDDDTQVYKKPWVGLTEDEAFVCRGRDYFETYKAIEAKLKEKNSD